MWAVKARAGLCLRLTATTPELMLLPPAPPPWHIPSIASRGRLVCPAQGRTPPTSSCQHCFIATVSPADQCILFSSHTLALSSDHTSRPLTITTALALPQVALADEGRPNATMQDAHGSPLTDTQSSLAQPDVESDRIPFETTSWVAIQAVAHKYNLSLRTRETVLRELTGVDHEPAREGTDVPVLDSLDQSSWVITARLTAQGRAVFRVAEAVEIQDGDWGETKVKQAKRSPAVGSKAASGSLLKNRGLSMRVAGQSPSLPSQALSSRAAAWSPEISHLSHSVCLQGGDVLGAILDHSQRSDQSSCLPPDIHSVWPNVTSDLTHSLDSRTRAGVYNGQATRRSEASLNLADGPDEGSCTYKAAHSMSEVSLRSEQSRSLEDVPLSSSRVLPTRGCNDHTSEVSNSAPTITELIGVLTSAINNRLMTDFFLTFRVFMNPRQLLELLIERFSWATNPDSCDANHRRIVLVRTYAILKYWLQHFFELDYLCDRDLRQRLTTWLNETGSALKAPHSAVEMSVIKSLKNLVRDLRDRYLRTGVSALLQDEHSWSTAHYTDGETAREAQVTSASGAGTETLFSLKYSAVQAERSSNDCRKIRSVPDTCHHKPTQTVKVPQHSHCRYMSPAPPYSQNVARPAPLPTFSYDPLTRAISSTVDALARIKRSMGNGGIKLHGAGDALAEDGFQRPDLLFQRDGLQAIVSFREEGRNERPCRDPDYTFHAAIGDLRDQSPSLSSSTTVSSKTPNCALHITDLPTGLCRKSKRDQQGVEVSRSPKVASVRESQDEICPRQHYVDQRARACSLDGAGTHWLSNEKRLWTDCLSRSVQSDRVISTSCITASAAKTWEGLPIEVLTHSLPHRLDILQGPCLAVQTLASHLDLFHKNRLAY